MRIVAIVLLCCGGLRSGSAQTKPTVKISAAPPGVALVDVRQPDWDGLWTTPFGGPAPQPGRSGRILPPAARITLPLTPAYQPKWAALVKTELDGDDVESNEKRCIPSGMPMMMGQAIEFGFSPRGLTIVSASQQVRHIWTDGRAHTNDDFLLDSFAGESIGHWDGDTLIVDTIALSPTNEITYGFRGVHMHITERIRQTEPDKIEIQTTVEDPKVLAKPWTTAKTYTRHRDQTMDFNYCIPALDRSVDRTTGKQGFDLTPPPEEGIGVNPP